ncbi:myosin II heavy chain [Schizosaccharomyces pombe]|uniref:Myosin type-2 heavy chain 1 n=1 Tax=Schizosaccharomyces pombe (strain 972 / ATCC 24843) TaxID=284812 RepID=MYO2_SCHPO|nr:myosin II heavy chain myo2 [Schizosaccharomyces pombe]Q9USI6.1 RecName: Full=Myosin type-2 heavy chain 1; AltName: Full=Myosin type II heavy chain 1 [Schizosaccharomyces pombe 972h-]CAB39901.1 myosin II heavy chain [Schizosaccharomyces pombe]|eukprot:NP_588114.1 myosin II heavy chain myo2 [Schizosaccharomyces pombe]
MTEVISNKITAKDGATSLKDIDDKRWVWISDPETAFTKAWIKEDLPDKKYVVRYNNSRDEKIVGEDEIDPVNPAKFDRVNDMAELTYLNEPAVTYNLEQRYLSDQIYTYSGLFLVAVNPYCGLPIYTKDIIQLYKDKTQERKLPHVFAIADLAYNNLLENKENQSILVTGESGAGKTENTKRIIQYLAAIASSTTVGSSQVEEQIIKTNPVLESFGNARTVRNNNSSRFGKFIKVEFSLSGEISNAAIEWYLLEKSRVVHQNEFERNYHVFYQLLSGADTALKNKLLLTDNCNDYRYLKDSVHIIDGVDDKEEFKTLLAAFKTLGFDDKENFDLFNILSIILHMGNIDVGADRSGIARLLNPDEIDKLCHLLGVSPELFSQNLVRPRIKAGHEWVISARSQTQVISSIEALAKAIYERNFGWLVKRLNTSLNHSNAQSYFIGILDIAGFEIFEKNSFEQLCINYTNEKLQQFFNHHMFVLEQEEYMKEEIVWDFIDFGHDLQPTIDLIEKANPIGILSCLDEECVMPKATDATFTSKLDALWRNKSLKYKPFKFADQGFILTHYAADVPYSTEGWLEKNTDPLNENVAKLLAQSTNKHVATLFSDYQETETKTVRGRTKKGLFRTVAQRHKEQLNQLMNQFNSTQPHFIRCIVPNEEKKMHTFNRPLVLGQLRCNGVLEGIRITRAGFPNRLPFNDFRVRYEIMAHLPTGTYVESRRASVMILEELKIDEASYRIGVSKIFFKAGVLAELEERRVATLQRLMTMLQTRIRGFLQRKIFQKRLKDIQAIKLLQANLQVYNEFRTFPWAKLFFNLRPLLSSTQNDKQLKKRDAEIIELKYELKKQQNSKSEVERDLVETNNSLTAVENLLTTERAIALDKEEILRRTQERLANIEDSFSETKQQNENLQRESASLKQINNELESELLEKTSKVETLLSEQNELKEKLSLEEKDLLDTKGELESLRENNATVLSEKAEFNEQCKSLQETIVTKDAELDKLTKYISDYKTEIQEMRLTNQKMNEKSIQQEGSLSESLKRVKKLERENSTLISDVSILKQQKEELSVLKGVQELTINNLEEKVNYLEADVKQLPKLKKELESLNDKDQLYQLQATKNKELEAKVKECLNNIKSLTKELENKEEKCQNLSDASLKYIELQEIHENLLLKVSDLENYKKKYEGLQLDLEGLKDVDTNFQELSKKHRDLTFNHESLLRQSASYKEKLSLASSENKDLSNKVSSLTKQVNELSPKASKVPELERKITNLMHEYSQLGKTFEDEKRKALIASRDNEELRSLKSELESKRKLEVEYQKVLEEVKTTRSLRSEVTLLRNKVADHESIRSKLSEVEMKLVDTRKELNSALDSCKKREAEIHRLKEHRPSGKENNIPAVKTTEPVLKNIPQRKTIFDLQQRNANQALYENLKRDYDRLNLEKHNLEKQVNELKGAEVSPQPTGQSLQHVNLAHAIELKALKDQINSEKAKMFSVQVQYEKREQELQKRIASLEKVNKDSLIDVRALRDRIASLEDELRAA